MGNGIYTNTELVDSLIVDLNNLPKELINGQFIHACTLISYMAQKLANLKKMMDSDLQSKDDYIAKLKEELKKAGREIVECKPEEIETVIGNIMGKNDHKESQRMVGENAKD